MLKSAQRIILHSSDDICTIAVRIFLSRGKEFYENY